MIISCKWCETEHEAGIDSFCSDDCHQNFNIACQLWGEGAYGAGEVTIWQLQRCLDRHARRARADPASEGTQAPETEMRPSGTLSAADAVAENGPC